MSAILVFTMKTTQCHPQVFLVNGALTRRRLHFGRYFLVKQKFLPNLVISNWLWWIMRVFSQSELGKYFEWIIILVNHFEENKLNWIKLWLDLYNFHLLELLQSTEETGKCRDCGYCTSRRNVLSNSWNSSLPWVFPPATSSQG